MFLGSGPYLHARVAIDLAKPLCRGVMLWSDRRARKEWYDLQYKEIPYFCFSCGIIGPLGIGSALLQQIGMWMVFSRTVKS